MNITFEPAHISVHVPEDTTILQAQRLAGLSPDAPCGGHGTCGKCRVLANGESVLACQTLVRPDMVVQTESDVSHVVLESGIDTAVALRPLRPDMRLHAAVDIGTTTIVCHLLSGVDGAILATSSMLNPQYTFGADVVTRIQAAIGGQMPELTESVRRGVAALVGESCQKAGADPQDIGVLSIVGNPCMQQLFLGVSPDNLAAPPFSPVLTEAKAIPAGEFVPCAPEASLLVVPDISGYVGADTIACVLASRLYEAESPTLLVDIGTNGEMVLGSRHGMTACATAAGPALEGAKIACGMRGAAGAIDHVWLEQGQIVFSVIGGGEAAGLCGSGLIDLAAVLLEQGAINRRGRLQVPEQSPQLARQFSIVDGSPRFTLCDGVYLTQEDIRELQLAKGAIAAGIELMVEELHVSLQDIDEVLLAGAFGSFINKESACAIGLLPPVLLEKIKSIGNAAASGSRRMALDREEFYRAETLCKKIHSLELAALPAFSRCFARHTWF